MIHNLVNDFIEDSKVGQLTMFDFERPSDIIEYCNKWKIEKEDGRYGSFENIMASQICSIRTDKKYGFKNYQSALYRLNIPCNIPLQMIISGLDNCTIEVELLGVRSVLVDINEVSYEKS
jgi:hypothetical protein